MTALVFGWVGTALLLSFNVPQVWRTCVRGLRDGVPASRAWVAIAVAALWLGYGLAGGGVVQIVLNAATIALNMLLLIGLRARLRGGGLLLVALAVALTIALVTAGGLVAVGTVGAVVGSVVSLPQLLALHQSGRHDGVSVVALALQIGGALCWLLYGLLRSEVVVWAPNVFVLLTTITTLLLLRLPLRAPLAAHA